MKISSVYALLAALALAGFPVVASVSELLSISSTPLSIALRSITFFLSLIILMLTLSGKTKLVKGRFWIPLLIFWICYSTRMYVDTVIGDNLLSRSRFEFWAWALGACFVPMLAFLTTTSVDFSERAFNVSGPMLFIAASLVAALGTGVYLNEAGLDVDIGRLNIRALNAISAGHLGLSLFVLSAWSLLLRKCPLWSWSGVFYGSGCLLGLYVVLTAASRGPLVALVVVLLFYFLSQSIGNKVRLLPIILLAAAGFAGALSYLENSGEFPLLSRISGISSEADPSVLERQAAYSGAVGQFLENPVFGDFLEERTTNYYPHNVILESFMSVGLIGGIAFTILLLQGVRASYFNLKMGIHDGWTGLIFIQYLVGAQFSGALYTSTIMWIYLALTVAAMQKRKPYD